MAGVCYPTINFIINKVWPQLIELTEQIIYKLLGKDGPFCFTARPISASNEHLIYWRCSLIQAIIYSGYKRERIQKFQLPETAENLITQ